MRTLLNKSARRYVKTRTGLGGEQLDLLGNTLYKIAVNEDMSSLKDMGHFVGMSHKKFRREIEDIIGAVQYSDYCNDIWDSRPTIEEFLYPLAAGLISSGFWVETPREPYERAFVRKWAGYLCPSTLIKSKGAFRGYLTFIEYVWMTINGTELTPAKWLSQRYTGNTQPSKNLKAYFSLMMEANPDFPAIAQMKSSFLGRSMRPTILLRKMREIIVEDWQKHLEERATEASRL